MRIYKKLYGRKLSPDYFSDNLEIPISFSFSATPAYCNVRLATLKYDKDFAHSFTFDDSLVSAITSGYPILAGGVADDGNTYPALYYTDGCGGNKVFKAASAFYTVNSSGTDLHNGTPSNLTYTQLKTLYNAGWDIINHSWSHANGTGNTPGYSLGRPNYSVEIENNRLAIQNNIVQDFPHFIIPAGDMNYLPAILSGNTVAIYNQAGAVFYGGSTGFRLDNIGMERPLKLFRVSRQETDTYPTIKANIDSIAALSINGAKYWFNDFTHTITSGLTNGGLTISDFSSYMGYVASTYGAAGSDRVWMAPLQEVWEYNNLRERTVVGVPIINGLNSNFSLYYNVSSLISRRFEWTIKVDTNQNITSVNVPYGYTNTFRGTGNTKIINISKLWGDKSGDFISRQSGNWNDTNSWFIKGFDGTLYPSPGIVPGIGNDVYIESGHTITLSANADCKSLYVHCTEVFNKLNTQIYTLSFYGYMVQYTGSIVSGTYAMGRTNNASSDFWILGTLIAKGKSRNISTGAAGSYMWGQAAQAGGFTLYIQLDDNNQILYFQNTPTLGAGNSLTLGGILIVSVGIIRFDYNCGFRLVENTSAVPSGMVTVKSGASLIFGSIMYRSASLNLTKVEIEQDGNLIECDRGTRTMNVLSDTFLMNGNYIIDPSTYSVETGSGISLLIATVPSYFNLILKQPGEARLTRNITINNKLSIQATGSTINKQSFSLLYDTNADLEYTETKTIGNELPNLGSGTAICRNLIVGAGKTVTASSAKNIRGIVILGAGASIIGTINQNQP